MLARIAAEIAAVKPATGEGAVRAKFAFFMTEAQTQIASEG